MDDESSTTPPPDDARTHGPGRRRTDHSAAEAAVELEAVTARRTSIRDRVEASLPILGAAIVVLMLVQAVFSVVLLRQTQKVSDNAASVSQVCDLVIDGHERRVEALKTTIEFLDSPAGQIKGGINDYLRQVSVPRQFSDLIQERNSLPANCLQGRKLTPIPDPRR